MSTVEIVGDVVDAEVLAEITTDVFTSMFGEDREVPRTTPATGVLLDVQSVVDIRGGWNGTVVFSCEMALVRSAAAELFGQPADDVDVADLCDLAGEVVNVVGGNVKSMLPGPSALSLPRTVLDGSGPPGLLAVSVDMEWCAHPLRVEVAPLELRAR